MSAITVESGIPAPVAGFHFAVSAAIVAGGRLLMVHRGPTRQWAPSLWDLPGGHVERHEREGAALARECREELGIAIEMSSIALIGRLIGPNYNVGYYSVNAWLGMPSNAAPEEHTEIAWFAQPEIERLHLADPEALPILRHAFRSELSPPAPRTAVRSLP